jgi:alanyl-tRNA synthetase
MSEQDYQLEYFRNEGLERRICSSCGAAFWTRDPERRVCGDAPCEPYTFIGDPVFAPHTLDEMREAYLSFFERSGHTRIDRYPVAARWRDDIYLTIASIADFQPFVTSGVTPPPANPLTISQPCIRLNDLDSVGRSGRHLTLFEMMAHHAFNTPENEVYWKDRTVELCDQFLASIGGDVTQVTYKEHPWFGGGNAGPSVEVLIGGLEVATLVFMSLGRQRTNDPPVELDGQLYYPMPNRIVDTGYGLERLTWAASGSPTIYDAVFPDLVSFLFAEAGLDHLLSNSTFTKVIALNAKFAGLMDITGANLFALRKKVAAAIDVPIDRLTKMITPIEQVYTIADHTRCLAYMLGDCIVPSNVREGYLARLVLRRTLRVMNELDLDLSLADLVEQQVLAIGENQFEQSPEVVREIIEREVEKYGATIERGTRIIQKVAATYKKKSQKVPLAEVMTLYDSHGLPPELVREVAATEGAVVEVPDNFYSLVANMHSESQRESEADPFAPYAERIAVLPPTRALYYEQPCEVEFEAMVLDFFDGLAVLDQSIFYPEGGGQPADTGTLLSSESMVRVEDVVKYGDVLLHRVPGGSLKRGERVKGMVDEERRWSLMRHHTATHVLLHAAKEVLGAHIHQAGAQKGSDSARLDIRHFKHITDDELRRIELRANEMVQNNKPVFVKLEERQRAEEKYGFSLYQGGVPPGNAIRVVQVGGEIQACAGTHVRTTGEIGAIKILRVEHIQDGVERLEFAAGRAAISAMQEVERLLADAAAELRIQPENLPSTVKRFFVEWKERGKEIDRLRKKLVDLELAQIEYETMGPAKVVIREIDVDPSQLAALARKLAKTNGVALLVSAGDRVHMVLASGTPRVNAAAVLGEVSGALGGKGGGNATMAQAIVPDGSKSADALKSGRRLLGQALNG